MSSPRSSLFREPCEGGLCYGKDQFTFFCAQCDCNFCDTCWDRQPAHKPNKRGSDGHAHEKIDRLVVERYRSILEPSSSTQEQDALHREDEDTTWFGIGRNQSDDPIIEDYGRYATLMAQSLSEVHKIRYPQLVSFIGQTGAGKSTVVKMLITHQDLKTNQTATAHLPSPVVGSINDAVPTSANVHLYADPHTIFTDTPLLYADCEGLEGGESAPKAEAYKIQVAQEPALVYRGLSGRTSQRKLQKKRHSVQRKLSWATGDEEKSKREYAVTQLYPRLLYTFSDVVVFVLRNSKTFESAVLTKLIDWASASFESSLGQPALPHIIIALNATDLSIDANQWDVEEATRKLLSDVENSINKLPSLQSHVQKWRAVGRSISTTKELLECYYSSVTVVRIPTKGRYMLIDDQVRKLHTEVITKCNESHYKKRRVRMLSNSDDLQLYLQLAFEHFSQTLDIPFNFIEVSLKINPIPSDFGGNILKLAVAMKDHQPTFTVAGIFDCLSLMVASCIMLDIHRNRRLGTPSQLLEEYYMSYCEHAFADFCTRHWLCKFTKKNVPCVNVLQGHDSKGHQNAAGKVLATGRYRASFDFENDMARWIQRLEEEITILQDSRNKVILSRADLTPEQVTPSLHVASMKRFYGRMGSLRSFLSHSTCFCCLRETPIHPLTCGHVLCSPCVRLYGVSRGKGLFEMFQCPLDLVKEESSQSCYINFKPSLAGVRVLSLDGGGMRGIVELEVLKAIETELPPDIPIRKFFDLIVGTSTGGIIALGLGVEGWSINDCITCFKALCNTAFTPREFHGVPVLELLTSINHGYSKYRTKPLEKVLQDTFTDQTLFGGHQLHPRPSVKVAITSTRETGQQAVLLANYNRSSQNDNQSSYLFERFEKPEQELKIWEAARATSAAPSYFKAFKSARNNRGYWDGALYHNNPVQVADLERRLIWPDTEGLPPDILLSIGTSCNHTIATEAQNILHQKASDLATSGAQEPRPKPFLRKSETGKLIKIMKNRVENILDTEITWLKFMSDAVRGDEDEKNRYQRVNPNIQTEPPKLDEADKLSQLQRQVHHAMKNRGMKKQICYIAHQLIASCFYIEILPLPGSHELTPFTSAKIQCRFPSDGQEIRSLGEKLKNATTQHFQPYFIIGEKGSDLTSSKIVLTLDTIQKMMLNASFDVGRVQIPVSSETAITTICLCMSPGEELPISGFPRALTVKKPTKVFSPSPADIVSKAMCSAWYSNPDETSSQLSESSKSTFSEIQRLPREARVSILRFIFKRILSLWATKDDVPDKMKRLAEVLSEDIYKCHWEEKISGPEEEEKDETESRVTNGEGGPYGTILHTACMIGNHWLVDMQLKAGVNVNAIDSHGWTALMVAQAQGNFACAKLLRKHVSTSERELTPSVFHPSGIVDSDANGAVKTCLDDLTMKSTGWHADVQIYPQARSNHPIPLTSSFFYYEITIINHGPNGSISFGLCRPEMSVWRRAGGKSSWAYHAWSGLKSNGLNETESHLVVSKYSDPYTKGDIVGCGINMATGKLFFTKNGLDLGVAFSDVTGMLFAVITIGDQETELRVNFGKQPFAYSIGDHNWTGEDLVIDEPSS